MILQIISRVDSTLISKVDKINNQIVEISKKITINPWIPLAAALLGGVIVWIGQYFDRRAKKEQEKIKEINEIYTKCEMLSFLVKNKLRELSTQKNLRMYWWHSHHLELTSPDCDNDLAKSYYDSCMTCASNAIDCNIKIGETLSEYYAQLSKFNVLAKENIDTNPITNILVNVTLDDAPIINQNLNSMDALAAYNANNTVLYTTYLNTYSALDTIIPQLKVICQKLNK